MRLPTLAQRPAAALIEELGTGLDLYDRTGAAWLNAGFVAVNEEFDFASAMMLDGVGAGLAALKRREANEQKAATIADIELGGPLRDEVEALRACGIHVYALLWGQVDAVTLRVIADRFGSGGELDAHAAVEAQTRPLEAWAAAGELRAAMLEAMSGLPAALSPYPAPSGAPHAQPAPPP